MTQERETILSLIKEALDESFPSIPPASTFVNEKTDLLSDIPLFMMEDLDEFLEYFGEVYLGVQAGEYTFNQTHLDDEEYYSSVENLINDIEIYMGQVESLLDDEDSEFFDPVSARIKKDAEDEPAIEDQPIIQSFQANPEVVQPELGGIYFTYSLKGEGFSKLMERFKVFHSSAPTLNSRIREYASSINLSAASLLDTFIKSEYMGAEEIDDKDIIPNIEMVLFNTHLLLSEYDLSKSEMLKNNGMEFALDFESPISVHYFCDLHSCSQMLMCVTSKLVETIVSKSGEDELPDIDIDDLIPEIHGIIAISNEIADHCGTDIERLVKL